MYAEITLIHCALFVTQCEFHIVQWKEVMCLCVCLCVFFLHLFENVNLAVPFIRHELHAKMQSHSSKIRYKETIGRQLSSANRRQIVILAICTAPKNEYIYMENHRKASVSHQNNWYAAVRHTIDHPTIFLLLFFLLQHISRSSSFS